MKEKQLDLFQEIHQGTRKFTVKGSVDKNLLSLKGYCYPENSGAVFGPIFNWIEDFLKENDGLDVILDFTYLNSSSNKQLTSLFDILDGYQDQKRVSVKWKYLEGDNDMKEQGGMYKEICNFPFVLEKYKEELEE